MVVRPDVIRVLEVDPDLAEDLEPAALAVARPKAIARAHWLERGRWQPFVAARDHRGALGLVVVDGFLAHPMQLGGRSLDEVLGPGDLLRPGVVFGASSSIPV